MRCPLTVPTAVTTKAAARTLICRQEVDERRHLDEAEADDAQQAGERRERYLARSACSRYSTAIAEHAGVEERGEPGATAALHVDAGAHDHAGHRHPGR